MSGDDAIHVDVDELKRYGREISLTAARPAIEASSTLGNMEPLVQ